MKRALLAGLALLLSVTAARAEPARVKASTGLSGVKVEASQVLQTDARTLWETITDYNRLASFIPDMISSRVISAPGRAQAGRTDCRCRTVRLRDAGSGCAGAGRNALQPYPVPRHFRESWCR
jgi:hypothetical protein